MDARAILERALESVGARSVYGEPYEQDGVTIVPVAAVRGGGGGGQDERANSSGGGFGLTARPVGAYIVRDGNVQWKAAIDVERLIVGAYAVAIVALLTLRSLVGARR
jgi:uncharacterized spore protein YtfJ